MVVRKLLFEVGEFSIDVTLPKGCLELVLKLFAIRRGEEIDNRYFNFLLPSPFTLLLVLNLELRTSMRISSWKRAPVAARFPNVPNQ